MNDKLQHALIAISITTFAGLLGVMVAFPAWWTGAMLAIGIFLGREERDDENRHKNDPTHKWWYSCNPLSWSDDGKMDFMAPAVAAMVVAGIFQLLA